MRSIFEKTNPAIEKIFLDAGKPEKVMCLPMDYAKRIHTALACNGAGDQLRAPFNVHNTPAGITFLDNVVDGLCRKHNIHKQHVFFGGEDCSSFCFNFVYALASEGRTVIGVNAKEAAKERENQIASTDEIDLLGIAGVLINKKRGRTISAEFGSAPVIRSMTHHRNSLVKSRTASALRTHHLVDQLLPGFLDESQSGITPFSRASLWLMSEKFSPKQVQSRRKASILQRFHDYSVHDPEATVEKLKDLARSVLPPPPALCESLQGNLSNEIEAYQALDSCVHRLDLDIARKLASTHGAMLTTVPGIGITLAAGLFAEIGDPARMRRIKQMTSLAGIVERLKQTGGPEKEARSRGRSRQGNRVLKKLIVDVALKMGQYGHPDLKADYSRREATGQDTRFTMARRMLRICNHIITECDFFLPPSLLKNQSPETMRAYYPQAWTSMLIKWRNAGAIQQAFAPGAPLEEWRTMLNELYDLNLSKKSPQASELRQR